MSSSCDRMRQVIEPSGTYWPATLVFVGVSTSAPCAVRIWNGVLFTAPKISDWNL